ncbi:MAG: GNAT family N-acetyltransferase [Bacteroidia bacterium]|nr:GNAT family N-acetyltransferase [Bacteroidia bacterium]NND10386.1 GNAT family N-acetyltransferase [Flavobacteriaceae bacterium]MBT8308983.1 GNAT family N-acetyltransferase [Bacteroidia bacterium]NNK27938.1 GNAT family N-acetyltransferase [Flavobacteriaceae bacterium]NNL60810.1 GNAT family N-acetyltransferase [Flavobacteriaceae bacterium]
MQINTKKFNELTNQELYDLLQLRSEVFVVEQDCVYQDLDGKDIKALHVMGYDEDELVAYTRIFKQGDYFNESSIGRVVVKKNSRQKKYGEAIMKASIKSIEERYESTLIKLSAQTYLKKFYNSLGFMETGPEYLEDGIPHVAMIKK